MARNWIQFQKGYSLTVLPPFSSLLYPESARGPA